MYDRTFDGKDLNFGVIGVDKGSLVMYDEGTGSLWSQLFGDAFRGEMKGRTLTKLASTMTTWEKWKALHPDTTVYVKSSIPYGSRYTEDAFAKIAGRAEGPARGRDLALGVEASVEARAYLLRRLAKDRLRNDELERAPILVYLSEDLATARVLERRVDERTLTFELAENDRIRDKETASLWDPLAGVALSGPLKGAKLRPYTTTFALWEVWKRYRPDTVLAGGP